MPRITKTLDATTDNMQTAKETAISLMQGSSVQQMAEDLFYADNLIEVETGLKKMNEFSNRSWILSSIVLYTIIYDNALYTQSGLSWAEYTQQARERIGLEPRDITEQLAAARFYISNQAELQRKGFNPSGNNRKLARAELATELCGNVHTTIEHLVKDSQREFIDWYQSFKPQKALPVEIKNNEIEFKDSKIYVKGKPAVTFSKTVPDDYKAKLEKYMEQIVNSIRQGYEPAIVPVYDEREARNLVNLRDKYRQKK